MKKNKKKGIILSVIIAVALTTAITVYAWFSLNREISTVTPVDTPTMLVLGSGNKEDISRFSLGDIDVETDEKSKDYVFCVYSESNPDYKIGIAHTTNIDFKYSIYNATLSEDNTGLLYIKQDGKSQFYTKGNIVNINWLNEQNSYQAAQSGDYYNYTYGGSEKVQSDAVPIYGKVLESVIHHDDRDKGFCDYYILHVDWTDVADKIRNNKETDIIYIIATSD